MSNIHVCTPLHRKSSATISFVQTPNRLCVGTPQHKQMVQNPQANPRLPQEGTDRLKHLLACRLPPAVQTCKASETSQTAFPKQGTPPNEPTHLSSEQRLARLAAKKMLLEEPPSRWTEVNISHCNVGMSLLSSLKNNTDAVCFLQCRVSPGKGNSNYQQWNHNLVYLSLYLNIGKIGFRRCQFDGQLTHAICSKLPNLFELDLSINKIGDEGAITIATELPKLRVLKLVDNGLTDSSGVELGNRLVDLQELCLNNNSFGYKTANAIALNLLKLRFLYLPDNQITDLGCIQLAASLSNLLKFWVRGNRLNKTTEMLTRSLVGANADLVL